MDSILSKYICPVPFKYTEITNTKQHMCCSEWLQPEIGSSTTLKDNWNSEIANNIRESILDGTYKYCSTEKCPHLNTLLKTGRSTYGLIEKELFNLNDEYSVEGPSTVKVVFDDACNLACPSCRVDFIRNNDKTYNTSTEILNSIKTNYKNNLKEIHMSGYGDPFYSQALFEFLCNFESKWFPNMEKIHLHTNAILWNTLNWNKISNCHPYIKSCEISIDAATKATYEKVRKGGNWDLLIKNLNFINSIDSLESITFSFVVQKENYSEIIKFYDLINNIFGISSKVKFQYYKILDWGVMKKNSYIDNAVWENTHPLYEDCKHYAHKLTEIKDTRVIFNI